MHFLNRVKDRSLDRRQARDSRHGGCWGTAAGPGVGARLRDRPHVVLRGSSVGLRVGRYQQYLVFTCGRHVVTLEGRRNGRKRGAETGLHGPGTRPRCRCGFLGRWHACRARARAAGRHRTRRRLIRPATDRGGAPPGTLRGPADGMFAIQTRAQKQSIGFATRAGTTTLHGASRGMERKAIQQ